MLTETRELTPGSDINFNSPSHRSSQDGSFIQDDADMHLILDFPPPGSGGKVGPGFRPSSVLSSSWITRQQTKWATDFDANIAELDFDNVATEDILAIGRDPLTDSREIWSPGIRDTHRAEGKFGLGDKDWNENTEISDSVSSILSPSELSHRTKGFSGSATGPPLGFLLQGSHQTPRIQGSLLDLSLSPSQSLFSSQCPDDQLLLDGIESEAAHAMAAATFISTDSLDSSSLAVDLENLKAACATRKRDYVLTFEPGKMAESGLAVSVAMDYYQDAKLSNALDQANGIFEEKSDHNQADSQELISSKNLTTWGRIRRSYEVGGGNEGVEGSPKSSSSLPNLSRSPLPSFGLGAGEKMSSGIKMQLYNMNQSSMSSSQFKSCLPGADSEYRDGMSLLRVFQNRLSSCSGNVKQNQTFSESQEDLDDSSGYITGETTVGGAPGQERISSFTAPDESTPTHTARVEDEGGFSEENNQEPGFQPTPAQVQDYGYAEFYVNGRYIDINHNEIGFIPPSTVGVQHAGAMAGVEPREAASVATTSTQELPDVARNHRAQFQLHNSSAEHSEQGLNRWAALTSPRLTRIAPTKPPRTFATLMEGGREDGTSSESDRSSSTRREYSVDRHDRRSRSASSVSVSRLRDSGTQVPVYVTDQSVQTSGYNNRKLVTTTSARDSGFGGTHTLISRSMSSDFASSSTREIPELFSGFPRFAETRTVESGRNLLSPRPSGSVPDLSFMRLPFSVPPFLNSVTPFPLAFLMESQLDFGTHIDVPTTDTGRLTEPEIDRCNQGVELVGGVGDKLPPPIPRQYRQQTQQSHHHYPQSHPRRTLSEGRERLAQPPKLPLPPTHFNTKGLAANSPTFSTNIGMGLPNAPPLFASKHPSAPSLIAAATHHGQSVPGVMEMPSYLQYQQLLQQHQLQREHQHQTSATKNSSSGNSSSGTGVPRDRDSGLGASGPSHIQDWESLATLLPKDVVQTCSFFKINPGILNRSQMGYGSPRESSGGEYGIESACIDKPKRSSRMQRPRKLHVHHRGRRHRPISEPSFDRGFHNSHCSFPGTIYESIHEEDDGGCMSGRRDLGGGCSSRGHRAVSCGCELTKRRATDMGCTGQCQCKPYSSCPTVEHAHPACTSVHQCPPIYCHNQPCNSHHHYCCERRYSECCDPQSLRKWRRYQETVMSCSYHDFYSESEESESDWEERRRGSSSFSSDEELDPLHPAFSRSEYYRTKSAGSARRVASLGDMKEHLNSSFLLPSSRNQYAHPPPPKVTGEGKKKRSRSEVKPCATCYRVRSPTLERPPIWAVRQPEKEFFCDCQTSDVLEENAEAERRRRRSRRVVSFLNGLRSDQLTDEEMVVKNTALYKEKRELVNEVCDVCDRLISAFSKSFPSTRDKVEKWDSSEVSDLIENSLCPVLEKVLADGLKPGISVWTLIRASAPLGPATKSIHELVSDLTESLGPVPGEHSLQLLAFVIGLLNMHSLDCWMSYLVLKDRLIAEKYEESAFLRNATLAYRSLFTRLMMAFQALSLLPFNGNGGVTPPPNRYSSNNISATGYGVRYNGIQTDGNGGANKMPGDGFSVSSNAFEENKSSEAKRGNRSSSVPPSVNARIAFHKELRLNFITPQDPYLPGAVPVTTSKQTRASANMTGISVRKDADAAASADDEAEDTKDVEEAEEMRTSYLMLPTRIPSDSRVPKSSSIPSRLSESCDNTPKSHSVDSGLTRFTKLKCGSPSRIPILTHPPPNSLPVTPIFANEKRSFARTILSQRKLVCAIEDIVGSPSMNLLGCAKGETLEVIAMPTGRYLRCRRGNAEGLIERDLVTFVTFI